MQQQAEEEEEEKVLLGILDSIKIDVPAQKEKVEKAWRKVVKKMDEEEEVEERAAEQWRHERAEKREKEKIEARKAAEDARKRAQAKSDARKRAQELEDAKTVMFLTKSAWKNKQALVSRRLERSSDGKETGRGDVWSITEEKEKEEEEEAEAATE